MIENYLGLSDGDGIGDRDISGLYAAGEGRATAETNELKENIRAFPELTESEVAAIERRAYAEADE